jgi:hypothetical protein
VVVALTAVYTSVLHSVLQQHLLPALIAAMIVLHFRYGTCAGADGACKQMMLFHWNIGKMVTQRGLF